MDFKLELVTLPVSDVDRAKAFYVDQAGFNADHDFQVDDPDGNAWAVQDLTGTRPE